MNSRLSLLSIFSIVLLFSASCKKETEHEHHENELITTVELSFTNISTSETKVFSWSDNDGPGGANPVIEDILLEAETEYNFSVRFLDRSQSVEEDITEEIEEEGDHHRVYYIVNGVNLNFSNLSKDQDGITLGLNGKITTGTSSTGNLQVILRHYANGGKNESDSPTQSSAGTDADVSFKVTVE